MCTRALSDVVPLPKQRQTQERVKCARRHTVPISPTFPRYRRCAPGRVEAGRRWNKGRSRVPYSGRRPCRMRNEFIGHKGGRIVELSAAARCGTGSRSEWDWDWLASGLGEVWIDQAPSIVWEVSACGLVAMFV